MVAIRKRERLGRMPGGGGWKAHCRAMGSTRARKQTVVGYEYVHSVVHDHSRLAYSEGLPDERGATCATFLDRAVAHLTDHGITRIERLITDNAWANWQSLRDVCAAHGIRQKFIKPHCPWQNCKVERFNRTLQTKWAHQQPSPRTTTAPRALTPGSSTTTPDDATQPSKATPISGL